MTPDDLDRILSSEDPLEVSSGFAMSVMDAVRRQASEPPRLAFPWVRFAMGLVACSVMALTGVVLLTRLEMPSVALTATLSTLGAIAPELGYATAVLLVSVALASLPRLLARE